MAAYLLDTNHLVNALKQKEPLRPRLTNARQQGHRFGICNPILCETEAYVQASVRRAENQKTLDRLLASILIWPLNRTTSRIFGELFHELRRKGRVLSQVDMMAAALARQMNLVILTTDRDFDALPDLKTENWLA